MSLATTIVWSATAMGGVTAGLFFLRFWRDSRDRLFLVFALAFFVLSLNWLALVAAPVATGTHHFAYVIRLVAFVLLLVGIVDKNRR